MMCQSTCPGCTPSTRAASRISPGATSRSCGLETGCSRRVSWPPGLAAATVIGSCRCTYDTLRHCHAREKLFVQLMPPPGPRVSGPAATGCERWYPSSMQEHTSMVSVSQGRARPRLRSPRHERRERTRSNRTDLRPGSRNDRGTATPFNRYGLADCRAALKSETRKRLDSTSCWRAVFEAEAVRDRDAKLTETSPGIPV